MYVALAVPAVQVGMSNLWRARQEPENIKYSQSTPLKFCPPRDTGIDRNTRIA